MLVRMLTTITGFRNGEAWPPIGGTIDLPDHEAADMIRNAYAEATDVAELEDQEDANEAEQDSDEDAGTPDDSDAAAEDGDPATDNLEDLERDELVTIAETEGVKIRSNAAADKIRDAIREARAAG